MVFDGKHLTSFDTHLLEDLKRAQAVPLEPEATVSPSHGAPRRPRRDRQVGAVVMASFVVLVVIAGAVLASRPPSGGGGGHTKVLPDPRLDHGAAEQQVLAALTQTAAAGNFNISYRLSETIGSTPPTTRCYKPATGPTATFVVPASGGTAWKTSPGDVQEQLGGEVRRLTDGGCFSTEHQAVTVTGKGTVNVAPKAMVVSANISSGLDVSVRLDGDNVWESGGADYGLSPNGDAMGSGPGQLLSGFASLVEGTLGPREGALAMTRMASPNAYLTLEQPSVTGAAPAGSGTVDGVPVTKYTVGIDLDQLVFTPGLTTDEITTIKQALDVLKGEGYAKTVDTVSVDADGFIRQVVSVSSFKDGGTVTHEATYSNFGCAGTVQMPGQPAPPPPSVACGAPGAPTSTTEAPTTGQAPTTGAPTTQAPSTTMPPAATDTPAKASTTTQPGTA